MVSKAFQSIGDDLQYGSAFESAPPPRSAPARLPDYAEATPQAAAFLEPIECSPASVLAQQSGCVRLDWEDLPRFTVVDRQFEPWGVVFANAVAVCPSNPAYPPYSGTMAIMGAPKGGWLEAKFVRPVKFVSSFVTSSRRIVLSAFDANNHLLALAETPTANLANSDAECTPNVWLSVQNLDIHRVTFHAFDGQFVLDDFCFCF